MSADAFLASSDAELASEILSELRLDSRLAEHFGAPPRVFDGETLGAALPYVELERHETKDTSASGVRSLEHQLQFATFSRHGGLRDAKALLGALRFALEGLKPSLSSQRIVLIIPTYCDVMRTKTQNIFRGVLRVRIHTEESK